LWSLLQVHQPRNFSSLLENMGDLKSFENQHIKNDSMTTMNNPMSSMMHVNRVGSSDSAPGIYADELGNYYELIPVGRDDLKKTLSSFEDCPVITVNNDDDSLFNYKQNKNFVYKLQEVRNTINTLQIII